MHDDDAQSPPSVSLTRLWPTVLLLVGLACEGSTTVAGSDASPPAADAGIEAGPVPTADAIYFADITSRTGVDWVRRPTDQLRTSVERLGAGVCVLDVDGVAPLDLFFAARPDGASRLFVGDGPLHYQDATEVYGLEVGSALGCLAFDADGDNDDDLLTLGEGGAELWRREAEGFRLADPISGDFEVDVVYVAAAAGDVDADGDLDLVIAGALRLDPTLDSDELTSSGVPVTADLLRHRGAANHLLLREGDGYRDASSLAPDVMREETTLAVGIGDFAATGETSIWIGNDRGAEYPNRLLVFRDGTWRDLGQELGFASNGRGYGIDTMGLSSGDLDRDGVLEHAVTSFETDATAIFDCLAPGECLDEGRGVGMDGSRTTFRWAPVFLDADLDGYVELVEATGHWYLDAEARTIGYEGREQQRANLHLGNLGSGLRTVRPRGDDGLAFPRPARGATRVDLDDDGRPDLVLTTTAGRQSILHNVAPIRGRWIALRLEGRAPNTRAIGARVEVETAAGPQRAELRSGEGYLGSFERRLFFGLGSAERATLRIRWPSGDTLERVLQIEELDREHLLRER